MFSVNPNTLVKVINCENIDWDPNLQSRITDSNNHREDSWGISQINLPANPEVTKEQAQNPDFSISFMAEKLSQNKGNMWTCYRKLNKS